MAVTSGLNRRDFLRATGAAALTLAITNLESVGGAAELTPAPAAPAQPQLAIPAYRGWEDLYRQKWTWDRVARGTHTMTNCVSGCAWDLYVKDDMVWREEQKSPYAASSPGLPDFNPRGCQKGACGAPLMYSPSRVRYPLRRVGARGEGRWERVSWDTAR
jgi:anaerobic selenocysteine-containing dehydrogenase